LSIPALAENEVVEAKLIQAEVTPPAEAKPAKNGFSNRCLLVFDDKSLMLDALMEIEEEKPKLTPGQALLNSTIEFKKGSENLWSLLIYF